MNDAASSEADVIVQNARIWTADARQPWAEALAVRDGSFVAVGSSVAVARFGGPRTEVIDLDGARVLPGLSEGHVHLNLGGGQVAFELPLLPTDGLDDIVEKVRDWSSSLDEDGWVVGGIIGATVFDTLADVRCRQRLDDAAGGRPVLLRDESMDNRWVSSRTLQLMGVGPDTPDPEGGRYVRDAWGRLTGVLHELASTVAESTFAATIVDSQSRVRTAVATALRVLNSYGFTSAHDAATMGPAYDALRDLEDSGELSARVVSSLPVRPFLEEGIVGDQLIERVRRDPGELVRPDFVKVVMDGVPTTRTTALLEPYLCTRGEEPTTGELYWMRADLLEQVRRCYDRGLGAKFHATGDASVRLVLDVVEQVRRERGAGPRFHIAHTEFVHPDDLPRFGALDVVADASPLIWFPSILQDSIQQQVPAALVEGSWPLRSLLDAGAVVAAGSDWPCSAPTPDPWTGLQAMVTRSNPHVPDAGTLNHRQAITLEEAVTAFTSAPAEAMGLGGVTGRIMPGRSADFIVLDQDIFNVDIDVVHRTRVLQTWFAGRLVHRAEVAVVA